MSAEREHPAWPPGPGRRTTGQRGSAVVACLVLISIAFLAVVGLRQLSGTVTHQLRCQGEALRTFETGETCGAGDRGLAVRGYEPSGLWDGLLSPVRRFLGLDAGEPEGASDPLPLDAYLASRFQVVGPEAQRSAPNQVTREELTQIARLFDDIRNERTRIEVHGRYREPSGRLVETEGFRQTMRDLAAILQTEGGRALVRQLATGDNGNENKTHIKHLPDDHKKIGYVMTLPGESPDVGENAHVSYLQGYFDDNEQTARRCNCHPWLHEVWRSDIVLYHELVHALHAVTGSEAKGDVYELTHLEEDGSPHVEYVQESEWAAVGIGRYATSPISENAYRAERRQIGRLGVGVLERDATLPHRPRYTPVSPEEYGQELLPELLPGPGTRSSYTTGLPDLGRRP